MDRNAIGINRRLWEANKMAKTIVLPLKQTKLHYLNDKDLSHYRITRTYIDFASGKPSEGFEQFIEPIKPEVVEEWLRTSQASHQDLVPLDSDDAFEYDNHLEAAFFNQLILGYLGDSSEEEDEEGEGPSILNTHTLWTEFTTSPHEVLWQRCQKQWNWSAESMLRWARNTNPRSKLDPAVPHTTCFLADEKPLDDNKLSTAEVITVVWLSCAHYLYTECQGHRIIPVTVFSTSGRKIRIVQGIVNFPKRTVEVRVSDIISFEEGRLKDHWREWLTLLGWTVGKPVGNTK